METIGEKIYKLRKKKGFSQEELGFEIGVSRQTISKWEANTMKPNADNIKQLCDIFSVSSSYFFNEAEIAVSDTYTEDVPKHARKKILVAVASILAVFIITLTITLVIMGQMLFTPNNGVVIVRSVHVNLNRFIYLSIIWGILAILEIIVCALIFKSKKT